jgi:hypothetical protein
MNASPQLSPQTLPFRKPHFAPAARDASFTEHEDTDGDDFRSARDAMKQIAALSTEKILELKRSELIDAIRSVRASHLRPGVLERLPLMDGDTLRRLVFLTRRYCRNRLLLAETSRCPNMYAVYCS